MTPNVILTRAVTGGGDTGTPARGWRRHRFRLTP